MIAPFLWRRGIRRIDLIVLSHPHPDHANGLATLVDNFDVGEVWTNGQETAQPGTVALLRAAARRHVPRRRAATAGARRRDDSCRSRRSTTTGALAVDPARGENDNSLVVTVGWRGRSLLFAGDLEADGEAALVARGDPASRPTWSRCRTTARRPRRRTSFVAATHPSLAVISVGERNRWGFPNPGVTARWRGVGARVMRTDRDGGVTVTVDRRGQVAVEGSL